MIKLVKMGAICLPSPIAGTLGPFKGRNKPPTGAASLAVSQSDVSSDVILSAMINVDPDLVRGFRG